MPKKFISNEVLRELLEKATFEERLSLTKILNSTRKEPLVAIIGAIRQRINFENTVIY